LFKKDEQNIPNENLKKGIIIKNTLKLFFYAIIGTSIISLGMLDYIMYFRKAEAGLDQTVQVLTYHNASIDSLQRYYLTQMFRSNYFDQEEQQREEDFLKQETILNKSISTLLSSTQFDILRNTLIFDSESTDQLYEIDLTKDDGILKQYQLTMTSLFSIYIEKIKMYSMNEANTFKFFIQENWFKHINKFIVDKGNALYTEKQEYIEWFFKLKTYIFGALCIIYLISFTFILRLSIIIKPCLNGLIAGFNFINDEPLAKIMIYFRIQISFLNELNM
jgi:hypothetical protein